MADAVQKAAVDVRVRKTGADFNSRPNPAVRTTTYGAGTDGQPLALVPEDDESGLDNQPVWEDVVDEPYWQVLPGQLEELFEELTELWNEVEEVTGFSPQRDDPTFQRAVAQVFSNILGSALPPAAAAPRHTAAFAKSGGVTISTSDLCAAFDAYLSRVATGLDGLDTIEQIYDSWAEEDHPNEVTKRSTLGGAIFAAMAGERVRFS